MMSSFALDELEVPCPEMILPAAFDVISVAEVTPEGKRLRRITCATFGVVSKMAAPAPPAGALIDPIVTGHHLANARSAEAEQSKDKADGGIKQIVWK